MRIGSEAVVIDSPGVAMRQGMALATGDRASGVLAGMSIAENIMLAAMRAVSVGGWVRYRAMQFMAQANAREVSIRTQDLLVDIATLSGGNQQKVLLARARAVAPRILLLDDPTRGVDVGVKEELYRLMNAWTDSGCAIILASSDLPELLAMSDRIMVFRRGRCAAEFAHDDATGARVMHAAVGEVLA